MFRKLSVLLYVTSNTAECNHDEGIMIVLFFFFPTFKANRLEISDVLYSVLEMPTAFLLCKVV